MGVILRKKRPHTPVRKEVNRAQHISYHFPNFMRDFELLPVPGSKCLATKRNVVQIKVVDDLLAIVNVLKEVVNWFVRAVYRPPLSAVNTMHSMSDQALRAMCSFHKG